MLTVNTNVSSLNTFSSLRKNQGAVAQGFERLSSGLRVNGAKDDAAGLSISTRMTAQIKGVQQANRNANDAVSYFQTAEGALQETTNILQRMRELVVQSGNETNNDADRRSIQSELDQLKAELNRINESTNFNNKQVFSQHKTLSVKQTLANGGKLNGYEVDYELDLDAGAPADFTDRRDAVIENLKSSWLRESEAMVEEHFGLFGSGNSIRVTFDAEAGDNATASALGGTAAFVQTTIPYTDPQRLHIDLYDFPIGDQPHGGNAPQYSDRIIAHEFVHLAMNVTGTRQASNSDSAWFNEGAAELLHGSADTRLAGQTDAQIQTMVDNFADAPDFNGDDITYGGAYIAAAYIHSKIVDSGGTGIKDLFSALQSGTSFNGALSLAGYGSRADFDADFAANGGAFGEMLRDQSAATGDTGSSHGSILGGGPVLTRESIVENTTYQDEEKRGGVRIDFQIGANSREELSTYVSSFNTDAMGLSELDVIDFDNFEAALYGLDDAIDFVSNQRSELGALQNRLESTMNSLQVFGENTSASRSRIVDADFAAETAQLSKAQIIQQASVSMLAQSNIQPQLALSLL